MPLGTLPDAERSTTALPSLETFRAEHDPGDFYSEKELSALYVEAYPHSTDPRARRYARLVERQLAALVWVEELLATEPQPQDSVAAWFDERLAARLILANIGTIGELHQRVRTRGYRWWVAVPASARKAQNAWWPGSTRTVIEDYLVTTAKWITEDVFLPSGQWRQRPSAGLS